VADGQAPIISAIEDFERAPVPAFKVMSRFVWALTGFESSNKIKRAIRNIQPDCPFLVKEERALKPFQQM
jgi:hypothetical protein